MSKESESGFRELEDGPYQLSDGRIVSKAEFDQALANYFEAKQLKDAENWAKRNKPELDMLYRAIADASRGGDLLRDPATQKETMQAIDHAHGEVLGETYSGPVGDVEHMSAVTAAAMYREAKTIEDEFKEAAQRGLTAPQALVRSQVLVVPPFIEGISPKNFIQALILTSIAKWIPLRADYDGKKFFVTPASKDWNTLRRLENTPAGQDWIDMAYSSSEQDSDDVFPE